MTTAFLLVVGLPEIRLRNQIEEALQWNEWIAGQCERWEPEFTLQAMLHSGLAKLRPDRPYGPSAAAHLPLHQAAEISQQAKLAWV